MPPRKINTDGTGSNGKDSGVNKGKQTVQVLPAPFAPASVHKGNGRGRPSKYISKYCELLLDHCRQGLSYESFAGRVGVAVKTLYLWEDAHPEFLQAKKEGLAYVRLWHEELLNLTAKQGGALVLDRKVIHPNGTIEEFFKIAPANVVALIWAMKNRLNDSEGASWKDRHEFSTPDDKPMQVEISHKLKELPDNMLRQYAEIVRVLKEVPKKGTP